MLRKIFWVEAGVLHKLHLKNLIKFLIKIWENQTRISGGTYIFYVAKAVVADIAVGYISDTFESAKFKTQHEHKDKRKPAIAQVRFSLCNYSI